MNPVRSDAALTVEVELTPQQRALKESLASLVASASQGARGMAEVMRKGHADTRRHMANALPLGRAVQHAVAQAEMLEAAVSEMAVYNPALSRREAVETLQRELASGKARVSGGRIWREDAWLEATGLPPDTIASIRKAPREVQAELVRLASLAQRKQVLDKCLPRVQRTITLRTGQKLTYTLVGRCLLSSLR